MTVQLLLSNYSLTSSGQLNASNAQSVGLKYGTHRHEHTEHSSSKVKARVNARAGVKAMARVNANAKARAKGDLDIMIQKIRGSNLEGGLKGFENVVKRTSKGVYRSPRRPAVTKHPMNPGGSSIISL